MNFARQLEYGQAGESRIANYLRHRGNTILPAYEKIIDTGKGPRLFTPDSVLIAPDFFVLPGTKAPCGLWIEAKTKSIFTWHAKSATWQTGIDERHYRDYCTIDDHYPTPIWLLFLHTKDRPDRPPKYPWPTHTCETGLFAHTIATLRQCIHHIDNDDSGARMVYWAKQRLIKLANLYEL